MKLDLKIIHRVEIEIDLNDEEKLNELGFYTEKEFEILKNGSYYEKCELIQNFIDLDTIEEYKEFDEVEVVSID